ncbi:MAG: DUF3667 domain-containing protein [Bacteroidota bacterium]
MNQQPPTPPERITLRALINSVIATFDINKGWIKTYRLLTTRPGKTLRTYLLEDRSILTKPFKLLIVSTAVVVFFMFKVVPKDAFIEGFLVGRNGAPSTEQQDAVAVDSSLLTTTLQNEDEAENTEKEEVSDQRKQAEHTKEAENFLAIFNQYYNVFMLLSIPFMALATSWFFGRKKYNYAEHIIFNTYVLSYQNFIFLLTLPLFIWGANSLTWSIYMLCAYGYAFYAAKRFFELSFWKSFWRSTCAFTIGTILYFIVAMIIVAIGVILYIFLIKGGK